MDDNSSLDDDALILRKLHDDELYLIFLYLDLPDLLRVEKLSPRFAAVAWQRYRTYKELDYFKYYRLLTEEQDEEIASRVGPNIEHLRIVTFSDKNVMPDFIFTHFPKLQRISLYDCYLSMDEKFIRNMGILMRRLKNLDLYAIDFSEGDLMDWLKVSQVESLRVKIPIPQGIFLIELSGIKELDLSTITARDPWRFSLYFQKFCTNNPLLQSLNIISCKWIDKKCLISIAKLKNLEVLKVSDQFAVEDKDYLILTKLTKLKHFALHGYKSDSYTIRMYIMLIEGITKHSKLESLTLIHSSITRFMGRMKAEKKRIVENLTHLKELHFHKFAIWENENLMKLPCNKILERVTIEDCGISADAIVELIARCPLLKYFKLFRSYFDGHFIEQILPHVKDRNHMLVLETEDDESDSEVGYDDEDDYANSWEKFEGLREIYKGVNSSKLQINYIEYTN